MSPEEQAALLDPLGILTNQEYEQVFIDLQEIACLRRSAEAWANQVAW